MKEELLNSLRESDIVEERELGSHGSKNHYKLEKLRNSERRVIKFAEGK